uniref:Reverse transcriptase zinc-binding domain-containing protein n=1 Tax=Setaria italica TaxID=4555 RepID=K4A1S5_SETIT
MATKVAPWAIQAIKKLIRGFLWCGMEVVAGVETMDHLLTGCVHSRETWFQILRYLGLQWLTPHVELPFFDWWIQVRKRVAKVQRKGFDSLIWLVAWSLWNERNH